MKSHCFALALVLALLLPQSVLAWNDTGHRVVAGIAWDNMTEDAQQAAIALLLKAPSNACLRNLFSQNPQRPLAVRQREFFMRAATWPDIVRSGPCSSFNRPPWHFMDRFWEGVSGDTGNDAPHDRTDIPTDVPNAVDRLTSFRRSVVCHSGSPCDPKSMRARQLAWILHLTGDIHQPLHTASRVSAQHSHGDVGGNSFRLDDDDKLHSYWDRIVDTKMPRQSGESINDYLDRVIERIVHDHPRSELLSDIHSAEFDRWAQEGFQLAKSSLYPENLHEHVAPSDAYRDVAFDIADRSIALAGYRLADLLNDVLVP